MGEEYNEPDPANPEGIDRNAVNRQRMRHHKGYQTQQQAGSFPLSSVHGRNSGNPVQPSRDPNVTQTGAIYDAEREPGGFQHERKGVTRGKQHGVYDWAKES